MSTLRRFLVRIWNFAANRRSDDRLREEMESHLALLIEENTRSGMPADEARRQAILKFGPAEAIREAAHAEHGFPLFQTLLQECRYSLRVLRKSPGFTIAAISILAIAIGATTAVFSLTRALFLQELPIPNPQSLVRITLDVKSPASTVNNLPLNLPFLHTIRRHAHAFSSAFGWYPTTALVQGPQKVELAPVALVTGNTFQSLGLKPAYGRLLRPEDDHLGGGPDGWAAVLSYGLWQQNYAAGKSILGKHISIANHDVTIVGIAPRGFRGVEIGNNPGIFLPLNFERVLQPQNPLCTKPGNSWLQVWARLKSGVSLAAANAEMPSVFHAAVVENLPAVVQNSPIVKESRFTVRPGATGWTSLRAEYKEPLTLFAAMAGLLLLAACFNLTGLSWVRASARGPELAMRSVLGASPLRLIRSVLTESFLIAMAGTLLGILFAWLMAGYLLFVLDNHSITAALSIAPSPVILAVACASGIACALLIGAAPSLLAARISLQSALRQSSRSLVSGAQTPLRRILIPLQLAITLVLLVVAGTLSLTVHNLLSVPLGFHPQNALIMPTDFARLPQKGPALVNLYRQVATRIAQSPGVGSASVAQITPLSGTEQIGSFVLSSSSPSKYHSYRYQVDSVGAGYFAAIGTHLIAGREFAWGTGDSDSCIVNQSAAMDLGGSQPILGKILRQSTGSLSTGELTTRECRVIGVAQDARYRNLRLPAGPMIFYPITTATPRIGSLSIVIRSRNEKAAAEAAAHVIHNLVPASPQLSPVSLLHQVDHSIVRERLLSVLSGFFAAVALLLSIIGLYGMTTTYVIRRRREIGLRVALGAQRAAVVRLVAGQALTAIFFGLLLGSVLVFLATGALQAFVFHVTPRSPEILLLSAGCLFMVMLLSVVAPVRRALSIDPQQVLREE